MHTIQSDMKIYTIVLAGKCSWNFFKATSHNFALFDKAAFLRALRGSVCNIQNIHLTQSLERLRNLNSLSLTYTQCMSAIQLTDLSLKLLE